MGETVSGGGQKFEAPEKGKCVIKMARPPNGQKRMQRKDLAELVTFAYKSSYWLTDLTASSGVHNSLNTYSSTTESYFTDILFIFVLFK